MTDDGFLADPEVDGPDDSPRRRELQHRQFDHRQEQLSEAELQRLADEVKQRHSSSAHKFEGDMDNVPQSLLMPDVNDANLWQVRVKPGRERDLVMSLMRKAIDLEMSTPLH